MRGKLRIRWEQGIEPGRYTGYVGEVHAADIERASNRAPRRYSVSVQSRRGGYSQVSHVPLAPASTLADAKRAALAYWEEPGGREELEERKAFLKKLRRERPDLFKENPGELLLITNPDGRPARLMLGETPELRAELERHAGVMRKVLGSIEREGSKEATSTRGAELMSREVIQLEYRHVEEAGQDVVRFHDFGKGVYMYALRNGEILLRHKDGKPLWDDL